MMKNMLKKMMVIGVGSMLLMGSSASANAMYEHPHFDNNRDHRCDCTIYVMEDNERIPTQCDEYMGACEDVNKDHYCDYGCGKKYGEHADTNRDHLCEYCTKPVSDHSGGTATCKDRAFCEVCNEPYGYFDSANHAGGTELRNVKPVTCTENGYTGDTYCKGCDTQLSTGSVIAPLIHNDTNNDHYCDNFVLDRYGFGICNEKISECSGGTATCVSQAVCDICGNQYGDIDSDNHAGETELQNVKGDTCTEDGYTGDRVCADCGTKIKTGRVIPATGHSGGTATCVSQAICEVCKKPYGEEDSDNHAGEMVTRNNKEATCEEDGYSGDIYCESCNNVVETGSELPRLGHIDEDTNHICDREACGKVLSECTGGEATCKDLAVCEYCGHEYGEKNMNNHVGDTEIRDAKEATCCEDGYTGDTYCTSCDTKLLDGELIAKLGHIDIPETETETETETEPITEPVTETETEKQPETTKQTEAPKPVTPATEKVVETESAYPVAPQTGDDTPFAAVAGLLVGSGAILAGGVAIKRRRK